MSQGRCYYKMAQNQYGEWNDYFSYANWSEMLPNSGSPATWWNRAYWFNSCTNTLDLVYQRQFYANERNCAIHTIPGTPCAWWAGIIETTPGPDNSGQLLWLPNVALPILGFKDSLIIPFKQGEPSGYFSAQFTDWNLPAAGLTQWHVDQLHPNDLWSVGTYNDADGDGVPDVTDNCPLRYNPSQALPPWSVPNGDSDCDGFPNTVAAGGKASESFLGTDPGASCAKTPIANDEVGPDAWPFDFNNDQLVGLSDAAAYSSLMGSHSPGPPYKQRFDLNGDGMIGLADVAMFSSVFGTRCTP